MERSGLEPLILGVILIFLAILIIGIVWLILRKKLRSWKPHISAFNPSVVGSVIQSGDAAVLLVQIGGKIQYTNKVARTWFSITGNQPNLERIARRARPSENFLGLCSTEGNAHFSMDGRLIEGRSYYIPGSDGSVGSYLISLQQVQLASTDGNSADQASRISNIFSQFHQSISSSLELDQTIKVVLEVIEQIIPVDFAQIAILDKADNNLRPYRLLGLAGNERRLDTKEEHYNVSMGLSGLVLANQQPVMIPNVDKFCIAHPELERAQYTFKSYLGLPLMVGDEVIGTLEVASLGLNAFNEGDITIANRLSSQAAVSLRNALRYADLQKKLVELTGLAKLTQSSGGQRKTFEFYSNLIDGIIPLVHVESIGFLIYDEARRRIAAQAPFFGIPSEFLPIYQVTLQPGSEGEKVWLSQQMIVAYPAAEDSQFIALGLSGFVRAAGLKNVALFPLLSAGKMLGYLQVADKQDGLLFNQVDFSMLSNICGQAATVIENLLLVKQSQERALRAETMRRIASLTGSVATLDEILAFSLRELARLLRVDMATIFLADESRAELRVHYGSVFGVDPEIANRLGRISMNAPEFPGTVTGSVRQLFCDNISQDDTLASMYHLFASVLGLNSLIDVPVIVRGQAIGEVLIGSLKPEFFDPSDLILLTTVADQMAFAIEKSQLSTQTDESLKRRVEQLTALTRIGRELNTNLDLRSLLELVYTELLRTTKACCGFIALYSQMESPDGERVAFMRVGDEGDDLLSPLETKVMAFEEPIIVVDYRKPIQSLGNVFLDAPHADVVSSLIVPISYQEGIAGLIHLHSREIDHFDKTALEITQTLATQAAIALGNASRYYDQCQRSELLSRRVETIEKLMEAARSVSPDQPLNLSLETIAYGIQESTPFDTILIGVYQLQYDVLHWSVGAGLPLDAIDEYRTTDQPWSAIVAKLSEDYRLGTVYMIPEDQVPYQLESSLIDAVMPTENPLPDQRHLWQSGDELLVVLQDVQRKPLGLIRVDHPRDGKRPDQPTLESLEIFASQASLLIESHQKLKIIDEKLRSTQLELDQTREAMVLSQQGLPQVEEHGAKAPRDFLLDRVDLQLAVEIADSVNRQTQRGEVLRIFTEKVLEWMGLAKAIVVEIRGEAPHLLQALGIPEEQTVNLEVLLGQRSPIKTTMQSKAMLWVPDLDANDDWKANQLLTMLQVKSFICLPILSGKEADAVVLLLAHTPFPSAAAEVIFILELLCRQVAVMLDKVRTQEEMNRRSQEVNLLLEFSRQLGSLDTLSILHSLAETALNAIPKANASMVGLWQAEQDRLIPQVAVGYIRNERMLEINYLAGQALPGRVFMHGEAVRIDDVNFSHEYNLSPEHLLLYRDATEGRLPVSSLAVPIQTSENRLGVIVLDNFRESGAFTQEDLDLVASLARQTALTLEHARLYQSAEQRAIQLQALTSVAGTLTSSLRIDALIKSLLGLVRSVIPYDTGTLWLRKDNELIVQAATGFEDNDQRLGLVVAIEDSLLLKDMIQTSQPILVNDVRIDDRFPRLLDTRYLTWLGIPLVSKGLVVGVIALEKLEANYYSDDNVKAMVTFAGQTAIALENAKLYEESTQRAQELDERSQRLSLLNRFSGELSGSLDLSFILNLTLRELSEAVHCDLVSSILFDTSGVPFLEAEQPMILDHYPVILPECSVFDRLFETLGIFLTDNVSSEKELESIQGFLTERSTRALLIIPLATGNDLQGLLMAHSIEPVRFEADEIELARTISNQAAVAVQNARLFQETERLFSETQQRSAELGILFDLGVNITQVLDQDRLIETTFENVIRMLDAETCGLVMVGLGDTLELRALDKGERIGPLSITRGGVSFSEYVLKTGEPLFIRDMDREQEMLPVQGFTLGEPVKTWLGVPLMVRGVTTGVLSVQSYRPNAFGESQLRLLRQAGNQLAVALDNARLFGNTQVYAADMAQRVSERTRELETEHNRSQTLLRIITELSASLDQDMVLNRTLQILNEASGAEYSMILLVHPEHGELYLRSWMTSASIKLPRQHTGGWKSSELLARWVVSNAQAVLIPNLLEDERWPKSSPERGSFHSVIAAPLLMGADSLGVLLLFHRRVGWFNQDMSDLAQAAAKQIAVSINNTQLFNLIRDQAERLGELLRNQHVEMSRSQAMLEAVADGVLVTDARRAITLFNASAEKILRLNRVQVVGQSLESFIGLFGKAAQEWVQTIQEWSENPDSRKPGESKSAQIELDDARVVSVHLSPVLLKNDFLGTVSIFQDITHLVELDRLKSEFVATVSHELRTPMTSIKGYVEILLMGAAGSLNDSQTHFLQVVRSNTDRLATLVNDLLDISRIEAGRVTLTLQPLEPQHLIRNSIDMITRRSIDENKPMKVDMEIVSDLPPAYGDRERVQQILDNLVQNAFQYTPEGGQIFIRAQANGEMVQFSVQDNGVGIPKDNQSRIFERFFRGENPLVLATSGTGLGLSIVKHLVEMHGGKIWFESSGAPGLGSVFSFTIPLFIRGKSENPDLVEQTETERK